MNSEDLGGKGVRLPETLVMIRYQERMSETWLERFLVGNAACEGVERCEPCAYLEHPSTIPDFETLWFTVVGCERRSSIAVSSQPTMRSTPSEHAAETNLKETA